MVSAIVLAKNEEGNIGECLKALRWCDEIVVIDDYSTDGTAELAKKHGAKVFKRHLADDFAAQRNFGLEKAKGEWVLFVDADERVSKALACEIKQRITHAGPETVVFCVRRVDVVWGRALKHGETGSSWLLRLAKRKAGVNRWKRAVHEFWDVDGCPDDLSEPLFHYPHQTLREFVSEVDYYSSLHARANLAEGKASSILKVIFWPRAKFISGWVFRMGFLDGMPGFMVAMMMSFHSFLAWSKLWLSSRECKVHSA